MNKYFVLFTVFFIFSISVKAQTVNKSYDKALADSLNVDDYGMKKYILVLLKPGSNNETDEKVIDSVFKGHMKNINRLAETGELVIAGPMLDNKLYRGIFVLNAENTENAEALLKTDPAIAGKYLEAELYLWYGSAALQETTKIHRKIEKLSY